MWINNEIECESSHTITEAEASGQQGEGEEGEGEEEQVSCMLYFVLYWVV